MMPNEHPVVVVGAGPAGMTAAHELVERGERVVLIEKTNRVGGIARTDEYKGYRFDIGGHRFFTRVPWVMEFWKRIMGDEFLRRPRESHILYRGKFFSYPVKPFEVVRKLGFVDSLRAMMSFVYARVRVHVRRIFGRPVGEENFEDYIVSHYGRRLFEHFFKSYTEKVWGVPCTEIRAAWAAQRIKGMSMWDMLKNALFPSRTTHTSLIEEFFYPRLGPGQMWEAVHKKICATDRAQFFFNAEPVVVHHEANMITHVDVRTSEGIVSLPARAVISSMPLKELCQLFSPPLPDHVRTAAHNLHYRDFLTVALIINRPHLFSDTWIYVHDPHVRVGRIQNFKNWSPDMVPHPETTCLGLEYFVFESDELWRMSDEALVALASDELVQIGLAARDEIIDGTVVRMPKAYPTYDRAYEAALPIVRDALGVFKNLYPVGRNGMHKYNNQDHAMLTAKLSVENIFGATHDVWGVNVDRVYHEEKNKTTP